MSDSIHTLNGTPVTTARLEKSFRGIPEISTSKVLLQVLAAALSQQTEATATLGNLPANIQAGKDFGPALLGLVPHQRQDLEGRIGKIFLQELVSLSGEQDLELFWQGLFHALERRESRRGDGVLAAALTALSESPDLSPDQRGLIQRKLETSLGGGSFGSRSEFFLSHLTSQAFDFKTLAPMLAAGLFGKVVQTAALGRLTASAPAWWSRGGMARFAAFSLGFGAEVTTLGAAHSLASSRASFGEEFGRSALTLAAMKIGIGAGRKASLPIPLTLIAGTMLAQKGEEALGWRQPAALGESLAEAGASALTFSLGMSLASRLLGSRFLEWQHRLDLRQRSLPGNPGSGTAFVARRFSAAAGFSEPGLFHGPPLPMFMSSNSSLPRPLGSGFGLLKSAPRVLERRIPASSGPGRPFELILSAENRLPFLAEIEGLEGQRTVIARRDGSLLWVKVDKKAFNHEGDPITPAGVTRLNYRLEEGETRGRAFLYYDEKAVTLFFIDLEESMITGGPAMRPGSGSVFMAWLAEQAWREGKSFNVTRITSPQTVKILEKMKLTGANCKVEACVRLNPESLDEEYRVLGEFDFGDKAAWRNHRFGADFFNVFGAK